jgi:hypothetical protein
MLAVNGKEYLVPVKTVDSDGGVAWKLIHHELSGATADDYTIAKRFNYTQGNGSERVTFTYDAASVKPNPRTLRVYGAEQLQRLVSALALNEGKCWINVETLSLEECLSRSEIRAKVAEQVASMYNQR